MEQKVKDTIAQYTDAWNTKGIEIIAAKLSAFWTAESTYVDPKNPKVTGIEELASFIQSVYDQMPDLVIIDTSKIDYHNNSGRFFWTMKIKNEVILTGMDYFEMNDQHQLTKIVGFFDEEYK